MNRNGAITTTLVILVTIKNDAGNKSENRIAINHCNGARNNYDTNDHIVEVTLAMRIIVE